MPPVDDCVVDFSYVTVGKRATHRDKFYDFKKVIDSLGFVVTPCTLQRR